MLSKMLVDGKLLCGAVHIAKTYILSMDSDGGSETTFTLGKTFGTSSRGVEIVDRAHRRGPGDSDGT